MFLVIHTNDLISCILWKKSYIEHRRTNNFQWLAIRTKLQFWHTSRISEMFQLHQRLMKKNKNICKNCQKEKLHMYSNATVRVQLNICVEDGPNSIQFQLLFELWKKSYLWQTCEKLSHLYVLLSFSTYRYNLHTTTHDHLSWFHGKV